MERANLSTYDVALFFNELKFEVEEIEERAYVHCPRYNQHIIKILILPFPKLVLIQYYNNPFLLPNPIYYITQIITALMQIAQTILLTQALKQQKNIIVI